ncbi:MAG: aldehyde dehydrogenase [Pseudomonadales bacterium]|nr:aldehyde dehydrogenase [Pseudomonadales bacterium]
MSSTVQIAGIEVSTEHFINGKRVASERKFTSISPIDGSKLAEISAGGKVETDAAVAAARNAFPAWAALGPEGRLPILKRFSKNILDNVEKLAAVETADNGSILAGNIMGGMPRAAHNIQFFAESAMKLNVQEIDSPTVNNFVRHDPAGVAALISPWNGPFMLTTWKVGPALAAGNTVVVKPPEWAPLSCSLMADLAQEAGIPAGVFNVVQGIGEEAGAALVSNDDLDRISFTGSTDTARIIGKAAAETLTPTSMELGGKSPFLVFEDADLDKAAQTLAMQYMNAGQVCLAGTRILVAESIADELQNKMKTAVSKLTIGDPREKTTRLGPLITQAHFDRVKGFVDRAIADGAQIVWGGKSAERGGLYFEPTLLSGVDPEWEISQKEVFGPVLTWQTFATEEEALKLANNTRYGLAAMLFTQSQERVARLERTLVAGTLWVNCFFVRELAAPFGGCKQSGIGREGGMWSFDFFCDVKNIAIAKGSLSGDE